MKRLMYLTMCLCAMLVAMSSCSGKSENGLIGKWEQTVDEAGAKVVVTYDFKESDKLTQTFDLKNDTPEMNIKGDGTCDYTYVDNTITFKFSASDFNFSKFEIEGVDNDMIDMAMEQMKSQMVNVEQKFTDVKIDGDKLTATFNGQEVTLKRI